MDTATIRKIRNASLDEHLSLVGLLNGKFSQLFTECYLMDSYVTKLYEYMVYYRDNLADISLKAICRKVENDLESARKSELLTGNEEKALLRVNAFLEKIWLELGSLTQEEQNLYEKVKEAFPKRPMVWKKRRKLRRRRFRMFLILWKLRLETVRKW